MGKTGRSIGLIKRAGWLFAAKTCLLLFGLVFAASITVSSKTYQSEFGSAVSVTSGLLATDKGFTAAGSSANATSCSNPITFGASPQIASTNITSGDLVYDVQVSSTNNSGIANTRFNVTFTLASTILGPVCIEAPASPQNGQVIDCKFDILATALPAAPYSFKLTIQ